MKSTILLFMTCVYCTGLAAAEVSVTACASATVTQTTIPQLISGFPEECITLNASLEEGEDGSYKAQSESKTLDFTFGGCNNLDWDTAYTMEHRWRYSIETIAGSGERATAFVTYSLSPVRFTEGAEEFVETVSGEVKPTFCEDRSLQLSAGFNIATGLDSSTLINRQDTNGIFHDPDNPGHGFDFNVHNQGFVVYYYGHTSDGERLWLISENITTDLAYGQPFDLLMYEVTDGVFGQPLLPETEWGTVSITLYDCDNGHADLDGQDGQVSMDLARLARSGDSSCE
jgi:hypothetical protein